MGEKFQTLDELNDYVEYLQLRHKPIPDWVKNEKERLQRESNINPKEFIFGTMAAHNKFMTPEKNKVVHDMADHLLEEGPKATQPCLLLGKVQCGKTDTFLSIMGLCFDRGIDISVVMTKGTNTLTEQTLKRLHKDFSYFEDKGSLGQKVIIKIYDILDLYHRGGLSDYELSAPNMKFIIVAKKERTNLEDLNSLFQHSAKMRDKKVLVCDDEADFASRAYYKRKGEMSLYAIAELIENFIKLPKYLRYLQITATPYSLFLQPDGTVMLREGKEASPWLPRYTGLVPIHKNYIGGKQYYVLSEDENSMYSCLFQPVDQICLDILSARNEFYLDTNVHSGNLDSLNYAVVSYLFASAVRSIQVRNRENKKFMSSCLIHCEIAKKNHDWQADLIEKIIDNIREAIVDNGNVDKHILGLEQDAYESLKHSNELGNKYELISEPFPEFSEVEKEIKKILGYNDFSVKIVNSEEPIATMLNEKGQLRLENALNIFIGGSILDRGITIDNMLCFFYGRDPSKFQMDTVLQHARMYGARSKEDMACTRFFTTEAIYDVLKTINNIDEMMYDYLRHHSDKIQSDDFTSMVIGYDRRINASAGNKYTPANTKVLKPFQRILPKGFQTGTASEIASTINEIDHILASVPGYRVANEDDKTDDPFFLLDYDTAFQIIHLISSTFRYGDEYNNNNYQWDENEMLTAIDHAVFGGDGKIWCQVYTNRSMSRERENIYDPRGRFIDAPESGAINIRSRRQAIDRPVLTLLRQNGSAARGWRDTPFWWPTLMLNQNMAAGIFTINSDKKFKEPRKQHVMEALKKYPKEEVLKLTVNLDAFISLLSGENNMLLRTIKPINSYLFLETDEHGNLKLADGVNPNKYYNLSSFNDGVFPFVMREFKYLHLRTSMDLSGSQAIIELNKERPYRLAPYRFQQYDTVYDSKANGHEVVDDTVCNWSVILYLGEIKDTLLTPEDEQYLEDYKNELQARTDNNNEEA